MILVFFTYISVSGLVQFNSELELNWIETKWVELEIGIESFQGTGIGIGIDISVKWNWPILFNSTNSYLLSYSVTSFRYTSFNVHSGFLTL